MCVCVFSLSSPLFSSVFFVVLSFAGCFFSTFNLSIIFIVVYFRFTRFYIGHKRIRIDASFKRHHSLTMNKYKMYFAFVGIVLKLCCWVFILINNNSSIAFFGNFRKLRPHLPARPFVHAICVWWFWCFSSSNFYAKNFSSVCTKNCNQTQT